MNGLDGYFSEKVYKFINNLFFKPITLKTHINFIISKTNILLIISLK